MGNFNFWGCFKRHSHIDVSQRYVGALFRHLSSLRKSEHRKPLIKILTRGIDAIVVHKAFNIGKSLVESAKSFGFDESVWLDSKEKHSTSRPKVSDIERLATFEVIQNELN